MIVRLVMPACVLGLWSSGAVATAPSAMEAEQSRLEEVICAAKGIDEVEALLEAEGFMYYLEKDGLSLMGVKHFSAESGIPEDHSLSVKMAFGPNRKTVKCDLIVEVE